MASFLLSYPSPEYMLGRKFPLHLSKLFWNALVDIWVEALLLPFLS